MPVWGSMCPYRRSGTIERTLGSDRYDVAIIGAGLVGLATARELLRRSPRSRLVVLEKEDGPARHQSGHNSGVIHSGVYYRPGSEKARLCVAGGALLTAYCDERGIRYERCGKLIVAASDTERGALDTLRQRGETNGLTGLRVLDPSEMRAVEPNVVGAAALHVPSAGIVDYAQVARALEADVRAAGGEIAYGREVGAIGRRDGTLRLHVGGTFIVTERAIGCAGLWSDRLARRAGANPEPRIVPFRGDYYVLRPERRSLVRALVYPVPDPRFPFLGVHFTRRIDGAVWLGPNAVLAFARAGYRRRDVSVGDLLETLGMAGFRHLARRYWRTGTAELYRDLSRRAFLAELRRYVPALTDADLLPGPSGVRAQAIAPDGTLVEDFVFDRVGGFLNVRNAPSPAATSSLAIAAAIADRLEAGEGVVASAV